VNGKLSKLAFMPNECKVSLLKMWGASHYTSFHFEVTAYRLQTDNYIKNEKNKSINSR